MKKRVLLISLMAALSLAASEIGTVTPFAGYVGYGDSSVKDNGFYGGVYMSRKDMHQQFDLQYSHLKLDYKDDTPTLGQNDFTFVYSNFSTQNYIVKGGVHYIDSDDYLTDGGLVFFGGVRYYEKISFDIGIDAYYSNYGNFSPALNVWQLAPSAGKYFRTAQSGDFYLNLQYLYITFEESNIVETVNSHKSRPNMHTIRSVTEYDNNSHSVQLSVTNYYGKFTTTGYVWGGKQAYAVRDGGFTVYNLAEVHKGGAGLKINYKIKEKLGFGFDLAYEKFTDTETAEDTNMIAAGLSFSYIF